MNRRVLAIVALLCGLAAFSSADEGMWLFNKAPKEQIKKEYNFTVSDPWLEHLRLGSVRFNNGGSGSFVSEDGLTFTNHHVGRVCLQQLSTEKKDYIKDGFYAKTQADEGKCPDLELNVLVDISDVTADVQQAAKPGMSDAEGAQAQRQRMSAIEKECSRKERPALRRRNPLRAAESTTSTSTKSTQTCALSLPPKRRWLSSAVTATTSSIRATISTSPTSASMKMTSRCISPTILKWSPTGTKGGDLVFVSGNPGGTERQLTMAELNFLKDFQTAFVIDLLTRRDKVLHEYAAQSAENARVSADDIFGVENSLKAYKGRQWRTRRQRADGKKAAAEQQAARRRRCRSQAQGRLRLGMGGESPKPSTFAGNSSFPYTFVERSGGFNATHGAVRPRPRCA